METTNDNSARVDEALARLQCPTTLDDRFEILQELVRYWHGEIRLEDGISVHEPSHLRLPLPLLKWYEWAGNRSEIMSGQNFLLAPSKLTVEDDRLVFYVENQGVYTWATSLENDDPPVFGRFEKEEPWEREEVTLSEHLILVCLFEAIMCHSRFGASSAWLPADKMRSIVAQIPPISIGNWRWPNSTSFYGRGGAFMFADRQSIKGDDGYSMWIGSKTAAPLLFLKSVVDETWDYVAL